MDAISTPAAQFSAEEHGLQSRQRGRHLSESTVVSASAPAAQSDDPTARALGALQQRRRLLMIAFHYPPSNTSSGGLRPLKFGKYLQELGWDSGVLTVPARCYQSTDDGLLQQIPQGISVHRSFCFDTKATLSIRGRYPGFLGVPDHYLSWLPSGASYAIRAVRSGGVDALFSTSPIPTAHLIALVTKRITKVPWVADFRDPWVETEGPEARGPLREAIELWLERQVVVHADRVLVTTREFADYLIQRYGPTVSQKIHAVYNGYDEDDFSRIVPKADESGCFTLVHAGLLDANYRNPEPILRGIRQCLDRGTVPEEKFRLRFIGAGDFAAGGALQEMIAKLHLDKVVSTVGRMPYGEALASVAGASALLLLQGGDDTRIAIPAKAFEYLRTGRLILAATPAVSATAKLVSEFAGCFVAEPYEPGDIARQLSALFETWRCGTREVDRIGGGLSRYSRRAAAAELARILNATVAGLSDDRCP